MKKINIRLTEKSYDVVVGKNVLPRLSKEILSGNITGKILVITDASVYELYRNEIESALKKVPNQIKYFVLKPGEDSKSSECLSGIYSFMISENYGRDALIIAFGGGIIGDLSGYAAATYMRGIPYIQLPTTLLADVDSSVGGKTGINFNHTKNVIGAFHQPKAVITELNFLNSLPQEEILCGAGEIIKYGFLSTTSFYTYLNKHISNLFLKDMTVLQKTIIESVSIKGAVVSYDEKERGLRKILNLGHTFAHGFESVLNYSVKHGEAVIAGIGCSLFLSRRLQIITEQKLNKFLDFISKVSINKKVLEADIEQLYSVMLKDKKNRSGKIKFVLVKDIGEILAEVEADKSDVEYAIKNYMALIN